MKHYTLQENEESAIDLTDRNHSVDAEVLTLTEIVSLK